MVERRKRLNAVREQLIHQAIVEIEAFRVWRAGAFWKDARPGNRESIGLCAQRLHQLNVFLVAMIVIGCGIAVAAIGDCSRLATKAVPDRRATAVFVYGALDLI